jgi:spermidine synthase
MGNNASPTSAEDLKQPETAPKQDKKAWLFYLTGFFSGMSVMALELGAQRLLAPYFSSSQIVWTIVIGTIMIAMSLGNILGGKMADKHQTPDVLFIWLFAAATWTALIPLCGKFVISGIALLLASFVTVGYLIWASVISCLLVFVFPLLVLGMVTPNIVKYATKNLESNGKIVGRVEAFNTLGSIIGTFLPTFVTIPFIGTSWTFLVFAFILYAICLGYFIFRKKLMIRTSFICGVALTIGVVASLRIGTAYWNNKILYEGESAYNYLRVEENDEEIIFSTNVLFGVQSVKMKKPGLTGMYYDYAMAAPIMSGALSQHTDILILGLGTGTFASQCLTYFTDCSIDGVEIDGKVVELARKYFSLPEQVNVTVEDGRAVLNTTKKKYDVIMVDAYRDITIPFQMSSVEFFTLVKDHLTERGTMVVNMNMSSAREGSIDDYLCGTIRSVFPYAYTANMGGKGTNTELFASYAFDCRESLSAAQPGIADSSLSSMMDSVSGKLKAVSPSSYILTDDKAQVERLGMEVMDELIADELSYYKEQFQGKSLSEIIRWLLS